MKMFLKRREDVNFGYANVQMCRCADVRMRECADNLQNALHAKRLWHVTPGGAIC